MNQKCIDKLTKKAGTIAIEHYKKKIASYVGQAGVAPVTDECIAMAVETEAGATIFLEGQRVCFICTDKNPDEPCNVDHLELV